MGYPQTKGFEFEFKTITEEGEFDGHASTFGNKDEGDDIVAEGAFTKDLKRTKGKVPILADHNIREHIGYNMKAEEVKKGLAVEGKLDLNVQRAREKHSLAKMAKELGVKMGLSIGYEVVKKSFDGSTRILEEVKLHEYSFTAFPMNVRATVGNMKGVEMCIDRPFDSALMALSGLINKDAEGNLLETKLEPEETENQVSIRLKSPGLFQANSFRQITLQKDAPRVFAIIGRLKGETTTTEQSLRFPKADGWDIPKAVKWARDHDFKTMVVDEMKDADKEPVIYLPESIFTSPRGMERGLRDAGFSISRAKAVASTAFAGLRDAGNDEEEIVKLITFIKGLDFLPC